MTQENNTPKIGIVDIQFIVNQTPSVLALRQDQQSKLNVLQQWVNSANAEIALISDQETKNNLAQKYQIELNQRQQVLQVEYGQRVQAIDAELSQLIAETAKKEGLDYVFAKGIVVYGGTDITEKVVALLK